MAAKKVLGIISNIVAVILYIPLCIYFIVLGLFILFAIGSTNSIFDLLALLGCYIWIGTPIACIVGIIFSIIFRKRDMYAASYVIQLLPIKTILIAGALIIISIITGNMYA